MNLKAQSKFIGDLLVKKGLLTKKQKDEINAQITDSPLESENNFEKLALSKGFVSEEKLLQAYSDHLSYSLADLKQLPIDTAAISKVPVKFANQKKVIPIQEEDGVLTIALRHPFDISIIDDLKTITNLDITCIIASEEEIENAIRFHYGTGAETVDRLISTQNKATPNTVQTQDISHDTKETDEGSMVNYVDQLIADAVKQRATDIHIEPFAKMLRIRYRIDGILYGAKTPEDIQQLHISIISRLKVMSRLNISEKRKPQDGRSKVTVNGEDLDLRVSTFPTLYGEGMSIRLLHSSAPLIGLKDIGFEEPNLSQITELLKKPNGIILVTGPTGSGKTTTLYSCIDLINEEKIKIVTLEDPVEYQMNGVNQIQVNPKADLTFASGFRSILRQDPDVVLVGEIRDGETAEIAMRAALTGHLILSTLHTNNASASIARLMDLGVEPFLLTNTLRAIIAQRLVRRICPSCKIQYTPEAHLTNSLGLSSAKDMKFYKGAGCDACHKTGYIGRIALIELLLVDEKIRNLITKEGAKDIFKEHTNAPGMKTLQEDGLTKVDAGLTTIEEIIRVLD